MRFASLLLLAACSTSGGPETPPETRTVVFTYPIDGQRDVPLGANLVVSFSAPAEATDCHVVGPLGTIDVAVDVTGDGKTLVVRPSALEPRTTYSIEIAGQAALQFTTRSDRPLAGAPSLIAFNGSDPARPGELRPIFETSTVQLVFSEPLDPRSVTLEPGSVELVDVTTGAAVPATLLARGIHVVLDPIAPLAAGGSYGVRLGDRIVDLGGERLAPAAFAFTPLDGVGSGAKQSTLRTRSDGDPVAAIAHTDSSNRIELAHPLIGTTTAALNPSTLVTELGDPKAQGGPIAFRIPKGQRLSAAAIEIALAGAVPSGLSTGEITIELLTDGGGRIYRNRYQPADTIPDNEHAPLLVDLSLDLAIFATDPTGNAVLAQTVLGVQLTGIAIADEGVLAIETLGAIEIGLLGITNAPTNLVLDLISDPDAPITTDVQSPTFLTSMPAPDTQDWVADEGIELVFDEPIDLDRARAGGIVLLDTAGGPIASTLEAHGSVVVVRPRTMLLDQHAYRIDLVDVVDLAGNVMPTGSFTVRTETIVATDVPPTVVAVQPGTPFALDTPRPTMLAANEQLAVVFDQRVRMSSMTRGTSCNTGSVRVERVDGSGTCLEVVPGTLRRQQRELAFVPDQPWTVDEHYRLHLVSGPNAACDAGELCGANGRAASFDPLAGTNAPGGPDLVVEFIGAPPSDATSLFTSASPRTDLNGSGRVEAGELVREQNRVALQIAGTSGLLDFANFTGPDCMPETPVVESCMYMIGAIPAQLGARRDNCVLSDGTTVSTCVPVAMTAQAMYSTSVAMTAGALGIGIPTETGMTVMRMREHADRPLEGYIIDRGGTPTMVVALDLYMDAPDMSLPLAQHDMHAKQLSVALEGPVTFRSDGRIALSLSNLADVPISVGINAPFGIQGAVNLVIPKGNMQLQLLSPPQRGGLR